MPEDLRNLGKHFGDVSIDSLTIEQDLIGDIGGTPTWTGENTFTAPPTGEQNVLRLKELDDTQPRVNYREHLGSMYLEGDTDPVITNIPSHFKRLVIYAEGFRPTSGAAVVTPRFNSDIEDGNYESYQITHDDSLAAQVRSDSRVARLRGRNENNSAFKLVLEGCSNQSFKTTFRNLMVTPANPDARIYQGWWDNTDVVEEILLKVIGNAMGEGSQLEVYGELGLRGDLR